MRKPSFGAGLLVLVAAAVNVHGQSYTIKLKLDPDPGQSVTVRESAKDTGFTRFFDNDGKLISEKKPVGGEMVFSETTLEKDGKLVTKYKRDYEMASVIRGDQKLKTYSYQGRTLLFESKGGSYRVGVVGKPPLDETELAKLVAQANAPSVQTIALRFLPTTEKVKVGDTWKLNVKGMITALKMGRFNEEKSTAEAKLVKVYTKDKMQFGVIEIKAHLLMERMGDLIRFDPPAVDELTGTVDIVIDGSSTVRSSTLTNKIMGKAKLNEGKPGAVTVEIETTTVVSDEHSAEKEDPKGREVPVVEFPAGKAEWKEFTSKEGKFSANFPDTPKVDTKKDDDGTVTINTIATTEKGAIVYIVSSTELAEETVKTDPKVVLESIAKTFAAGTKSKKEITLNGFPGLEIVREFEKGGTKSYMKTHVYMVKNRLVQVFVFTDLDKKDKAEADKFLESFHLSEKAEEKKEPGK